jgi:carbon-monoxide dehydrogenase medium subunit
MREFLAPTTLPEALEALATGGSVPLAGGTALVQLLKQELTEADRLVWLGRVVELRGIRRKDGRLEVGAMTTLAELARSPTALQLHPALATAAAVVGNPRVRSVATIGGALAHADPRQDLPPVLLALGASATIASPDGQREVPLSEFFHSLMETALRPGELVTAVTLPADTLGDRERYVRFTPGSPADFPTVGVAVRVRREGETVTDAALALAGVAPRPVLVTEAAAALVGRQPGPREVEAAADAAEAAADPVDDHRGSAAYKRAMTRLFARRALTQVLRT